MNTMHDLSFCLNVVQSTAQAFDAIAKYSLNNLPNSKKNSDLLLLLFQNFNKVWRDQNEKFYLKSLDHQGLQFKQTDIRNLRSKSLLNEIETLYDERHEQEEANNGGDHPSSQAAVGPHKTLDYHDPAILIDANNLLIHHVKRQTGIHKDDKHKIKVLLRHFLLDLFKHQRQDLSDDERDEDDEDEKAAEEEKEDAVSDKEGGDKDKEKNGGGSKATRAERARKKKDDSEGQKAPGKKANKKEKENAVTEAEVKAELSKGGGSNGRRTPLHARDMEGDESYSHIMCNNHWYIFFRLHHILCERLTKMYNQSLIIRAEETKDRGHRKESTAVALRLKPKSEWCRHLLVRRTSPTSHSLKLS